MSVEEDNKAIVRQYNDLFIRNDLSTEQVIALWHPASSIIGLECQTWLA